MATKVDAEAIQRNAQQALADREKQMEKDFARMHHSGVAFANNLRAVRDNREYLVSYKTFEDYAKLRWNISRSRAYQLCDLSLVNANMRPLLDTPEWGNRMSTLWTRGPDDETSLPERFCRQLAKIEDAEKQREALEAAAKRAEDDDRTGLWSERSGTYRKGTPCLADGGRNDGDEIGSGSDPA